jgi:hypothetical protein
VTGDRSDRSSSSPSSSSSKRRPELAEEDLKYNLDEFVIPACNSKGASSKEWFRISPEMDRAIDIVIQRRVFPFQTKSDLVRHAIMRELEFLHRVAPNMPKHLLVACRAMNLACGDERIKSETEHSFKRMEEQVRQHLELGDEGEATRVIAQMKAQLDDVPEGAWKRRFVKKFWADYGHHLQVAANASAAAASSGLRVVGG